MSLRRHSFKLADSLIPMRSTSGEYLRAPEWAYWHRLWDACTRLLITPCETLGPPCGMPWSALPSRRFSVTCSLSRCHELSESTPCGAPRDSPHLRESPA